MSLIRTTPYDVLTNHVLQKTGRILIVDFVGYGLQCYECMETSTEYGGCAEPFRRTKVAIKECPSSPDQACLKKIAAHVTDGRKTGLGKFLRALLCDLGS